MPSRRDTWIRTATFVGVTYVWSFFFMGMAISDGEITLLSALGGMWSPFVCFTITMTAVSFAFSAAAAVIVAGFFWMERRELPGPDDVPGAALHVQTESPV